MKPTLAQIREALANYIASEGCSCCQNIRRHDEAKAVLGRLLRVKKFSDGSGYDFWAYQRKEAK